MEHTPSLAAEEGSPRRSLILAGGGMRVAWQAGVLKALEAAGLRFAHADGTSGGIDQPGDAALRALARGDVRALADAAGARLRLAAAAAPVPARAAAARLRRRRRHRRAGLPPSRRRCRGDPLGARDRGHLQRLQPRDRRSTRRSGIARSTSRRSSPASRCR